ncbi:uncharacterized protein LOC142139351 [Mixophyes fleayi]|uniref:uncharacterized protein LOC142139351 n=1 Tax=Mixophyes fleayi TaxID=3061075 RepID=UPI003F4D9444
MESPSLPASFCGRPRPFLVQGPSLWPGVSFSSIHQDHGEHAKTEGNHCSSLSGRSSAEGSVSGNIVLSGADHNGVFGSPWVDPKCSKILPYPSSAHALSGFTVRHSVTESLSTSGQDQRPPAQNQGSVGLSSGVHAQLHEAAGDYGVSVRGGPVRTVPFPFSPAAGPSEVVGVSQSARQADHPPVETDSAFSDVVVVHKNLDKGQSLQSGLWTLVTTDASLLGWGGVMGSLRFRGLWSSQEAVLPISVLELRAVLRTLIEAQRFLVGKPLQIQSDNAMAVAYINHQGGTRAMQETAKIMLWAESHVPRISAVYIPGVENWEADFLSRQKVDLGEWSLCKETFALLVQRWGMPEIDLMASRLNHQVPLYCARSRDPLAHASDAMTIPWRFRLVYLFPPIPFQSRVLKKLKRERVPAILVAHGLAGRVSRTF